jgi:hypothetical protein
MNVQSIPLQVLLVWPAEIIFLINAVLLTVLGYSLFFILYNICSKKMNDNHCATVRGDCNEDPYCDLINGFYFIFFAI